MRPPAAGEGGRRCPARSPRASQPSHQRCRDHAREQQSRARATGRPTAFRAAGRGAAPPLAVGSPRALAQNRGLADRERQAGAHRRCRRARARAAVGGPPPRAPARRLPAHQQKRTASPPTTNARARSRATAGRPPAPTRPAPGATPAARLAAGTADAERERAAGHVPVGPREHLPDDLGTLPRRNLGTSEPRAHAASPPARTRIPAPTRPRPSSSHSTRKRAEISSLNRSPDRAAGRSSARRASAGLRPDQHGVSPGPCGRGGEERQHPAARRCVRAIAHPQRTRTCSSARVPEDDRHAVAAAGRACPGW